MRGPEAELLCLFKREYRAGASLTELRREEDMSAFRDRCS